MAQTWSYYIILLIFADVYVYMHIYTYIFTTMWTTTIIEHFSDLWYANRSSQLLQCKREEPTPATSALVSNAASAAMTMLHQWLASHTPACTWMKYRNSWNYHTPTLGVYKITTHLNIFGCKEMHKITTQKQLELLHPYTSSVYNYYTSEYLWREGDVHPTLGVYLYNNKNIFHVWYLGTADRQAQ